MFFNNALLINRYVQLYSVTWLESNCIIYVLGESKDSEFLKILGFRVFAFFELSESLELDVFFA